MEATTETATPPVSWQRAILFYITAFFVLLGIFSLFSFLFLVPFVIDPALTTIFMEFEERPTRCVTVATHRRLGASNCSWTSCKEGCTKDVFDCTQIYVIYDVLMNSTDDNVTTPLLAANTTVVAPLQFQSIVTPLEAFNISEAKLLPNVKGCGYPPSLNCSIWLASYRTVGANFTCYYSKTDPGVVVSHFDSWQTYLNLIYATCIPIPSFILSVIYLTVAYFKIYTNEEEEAAAPLEKNAEDIDVEGENEINQTPVPPASGRITPASETFREDLASFGHHFKVAMADEMSRDSIVDGIVTSVSIGGGIGKTMTTSISTTGGPVADI